MLNHGIDGNRNSYRELGDGRTFRVTYLEDLGWTGVEGPAGVRLNYVTENGKVCPGVDLSRSELPAFFAAVADLLVESRSEATP